MPDLVRYVSDAIRHAVGFQVECFTCHHTRILDMRLVAQMVGPDRTIRWLRRHLKCGRCGAKGNALELHPIRLEHLTPIAGAFGGAYDDALEIPGQAPRIKALEGPLLRGPRGKTSR